MGWPNFKGKGGQGSGIRGWGLGLRGGWWAGTEGVRVGSGSRSDAVRVAVGFSPRKAMPRHARASRSDAMKRAFRRRLPRSAIMASLRDARPRGASSDRGLKTHGYRRAVATRRWAPQAALRTSPRPIEEPRTVQSSHPRLAVRKRLAKMTGVIDGNVRGGRPKHAAIDLIRPSAQ